MTSNQHGPYVRGYTRVTMGGTMGRCPATGGQSFKAPPSSDWSLQPDSTKRISHGAVNTFPGLVHTARQAMKAGGT